MLWCLGFGQHIAPSDAKSEKRPEGFPPVAALAAADGIAAIFAHEGSEIISDPDATAWYGCI